MALRTRLGGNPSFSEVCGACARPRSGAYAHQELPFERVVEFLNVPRDPALQPDLPGQLPRQDGARLPLRLAGMQTSLVPVDIGFSRFDLALELHVEPDCISGYFEFDRDLFDAATRRRFAADFAGCSRRCWPSPRRRCSRSRCRTAVVAAPDGFRGFRRRRARSADQTS